MPRTKNRDLATWHHHGLALFQALDIEVCCFGRGLHGRRGSGQPELHGLGEDLEGRIRI